MRPGSRRWCGVQLLLAAAALPWLAHGAQSPPEQAAGALRFIVRELRLLEAEFGASPVELFVAMRAPGLLLREVSLQLGDAPALRRRYSDAESLALQASRGLMSLHRATLAPGTQRLRAFVSARRIDAAPSDAPIRLAIEQTIPVGAVLELALVEDGLISTPALSLRVPEGDADARAAHYEAALAAVPLPEEALHAYNAALQALAAGDETLAALDALGRQKVADPAAWMLRDHANLALGEHLLRSGRSEPAAEALRRVRSPGPYENRALLALGWAALTPRTAEPSPTVPEDWALAQHIERLAALPRLPDERVSSAQQARGRALEQALVPWLELIGRDPLDPAVQEGHLAVAWALDQLAAHEQARMHYERTLATLEGARGVLRQAQDAVAAADWLETAPADGWQHWWSERTHATDSGYLRSLMQAPEFLAAFAPYRGTQLRRQQLAPLAARLAALPPNAPRAAALRQDLDMLDAELRRDAHAQHARLQDVALQQLRALQRQTERYLVLAHLALARQHDRAALQP